MKLVAYYKKGLCYILIFVANDGSIHHLVNMFAPSFKGEYAIPCLTEEQGIAYAETANKDEQSAVVIPMYEHKCLECDNPVETAMTFCSHNCYVDSL